MKICKECNNEKHLTEYGTHKTTADGYNPKCKACISNYQRKYREKNKKKLNEYHLQYAANNRETAKARTKQWIRDNAEQKKENDRRYYQENRETLLKKEKQKYQQNKEIKKNRAKQWREKNPDRVAANLANRRANKKQATPKWANLKEIEKLYTEAKLLTKQNNEEYQVDHIVPLNSDIVCGLHWENNLQVITAIDNNSKNNKLLEELL